MTNLNKTLLNSFKQTKFNSISTENSLHDNDSFQASVRFANLTLPLCIRSTIVLTCMMMNLGGTAYAEDQLKAFACAQGFGASATGGRGGDVYHVTKLTDDRSSGTLRHALESAKGPRTVVFDVGGIIKLNSRLKLRTNKITLAGQTAPGGGITLAGYPLDIVDRSDVIIRYMRFRVGDYNARDPKDKNKGNGNKDLGGAGGDAIYAFNTNRLIFDHISASWSMDEVVDILESKNITLQHSIVSEGLYDSYNPLGPHSRGIMLFAGASDNELAKGLGGYTLYQNLIANNNIRNPVVGGQMYLDPGQAKKDRRFMGMDFVNNVVYNWGERSGHTGRPNTTMNYINNYLIAGPSTTSKNLNTAMREENDDEGGFFIYFAGNYMDTDKDSIHNGQPVGGGAFLGYEPGEFIHKAFPFPAINPVLSANDGYLEVIGHAGSSIARDDVDSRIIDGVLNRTGRLIDSQDDVGGLGPIAKGTRLIDTDGDGMPDNWELANGLNPTNAKDRNNIDLNTLGYTNLEIYLDSIVTAAGHCGDNSNEVEPPVNQSDNDVNSSEQIIVESATADSEETTTLDIQISSRNDDAEEKDSGRVIIGSGDLDLVRSGGNQTIGMRFTAVKIPKGARINKAHIQFTAASAGSKPTTLVVHGKAEDDVSVFNNKVAFAISSARTTSASVAWSPKAWLTIGESGSNQRTSNIASIIQEIVDRPGWDQGHALALIISGTGKRDAESYDGSPDAAPRLHIEYSTNIVKQDINNVPTLSIQAPIDGLNASVSDKLAFIGTSDDNEDGDLTANLNWTSNLDGLLGSGGTISTSLSEGAHIITASATDSAGLSASKTVRVTIKAKAVKTDPVETTTLDIRISARSDDAEERNSGRVIIGSGDLDLVRSGGNQTIGMRFTTVSIPKGAKITKAHIQFTAASAKSERTTLAIHGKAEDNVSVFNNKVAFAISSARTTSASVTWSPKAWSTIGESGSNQRTPNIASIIQEIVNRPGWGQGHALAVIISGTGKRDAESYDGNPNTAPSLHVEYVIN